MTFRQSGGFAGIETGCELDTRSMDPDEGNLLGSLVRSVLDQVNTPPAHQEARDTMNYEITVEQSEGFRRLLFDDLTAPPAAGPLLQFLRERSGPRSA